ncbi:MAG: AAA family ATPase [Eubacterium sp.]|nr:AAA family ATPase [Eubacterium sp.]
MQIKSLRIKNFKLISDMRLSNLDNVLILVGKNNTGKTAVLEALQILGGKYQISLSDFREDYPNVEIEVCLEITEQDLHSLHEEGRISSFRRYDKWLEDFSGHFPSYQDGQITFTYVANRDGKVRYDDGTSKNNPLLKELIPDIYSMDSGRSVMDLQDTLFFLKENDMVRLMREDRCLFDRHKSCNRCFSCIGLINKKSPEDLTAFETSRLLDYKLYQMNLNDFSLHMNENYRNNGGTEELIYSMNRDPDQLFTVTAKFKGENQNNPMPLSQMGRGMKSIYMLSLLETYAQSEMQNPGIILVEEPELFLHPKLVKTAGDILYRLSRKNQVIFTTHSANLLQNFNSRQIRQIILNDSGDSTVLRGTNISRILDDLGYNAADIMNVDFVFIVEGKQDKSRLPLLLRKYYKEIYDENGKLSRVSIITTNSCTNIHTYANLKYMNQVYLKDNFLMIRDGDGKDAGELTRQLCNYYAQSSRVDSDRLPRVTKDNVLILKYYSFENYFLNPDIMAQVGVIKKPEDFYRILLGKWKEYLKNIRSGKALIKAIGKDPETVEDLKAYREDILIHVRGHNLFDIFYGRYRKKEQDILRRYIDLAPREEFADILDAIDRFIYFRNHKS